MSCTHPKAPPSHEHYQNRFYNLSQFGTSGVGLAWEPSSCGWVRFRVRGGGRLGEGGGYWGALDSCFKQLSDARNSFLFK